MGPIWDFDRSSGNSNDTVRYTPRSPYPVVSPYGIHAGEYNYWFRYLLGTPEFFALVSERWNEVRDSKIIRTIDYINYLADTFHGSFSRNFQRHPVFTRSPSWAWVVAPEARRISSFEGQVEYLVGFLSNRVIWLNDFFMYG